MKKILLMLSLMMTILLCSWAIVSAEEVEGLSEALDKIIMDRNFTQEQFDEMDKQYIEEFNDWFWNEYLKPTKLLGRMNTDSDEAEYEYCLNRDRPNYAYGVLVSAINKKYAKQYSEGNVLSYLFDQSERYWAVMHRTGYGVAATFSETGESIRPTDSITLTCKMIDSVKDKESIKEQLLQKNEVKVKDLKILRIRRGIVLLYIKCDSNEYLMKLYGSDGSGKCIPQIEEYTLYPAQEVVEALASHEGEDWPYRQLIAREIVQTKPTYQTEAEALQSEGLLHGNDNGLDLLKPLSRIEAAAMLLRAIDESEETTQTTPAFIDVPQTHWGYGAAENAYALGIINGVGNNQFAPDKTVTATEFATMLLRSAKEQNFDWTQAINILIDKGILTEEETKTMDFFTRGDMAKIIYEAQQHGLLI